MKAFSKNTCSSVPSPREEGARERKERKAGRNDKNQALIYYSTDTNNE
jgi:hypothetical protein